MAGSVYYFGLVVTYLLFLKENENHFQIMHNMPYLVQVMFALERTKIYIFNPTD